VTRRQRRAEFVRGIQLPVELRRYRHIQQPCVLLQRRDRGLAGLAPVRRLSFGTAGHVDDHS
jgi:hypothetical protein